MTPEKIITKYVTEQPEGECWPWKGVLKPNGYGSLFSNYKTHLAHRFLYEFWVGKVPDGLVLDHTCHNNTSCTLVSECPHRACVNPSHLEPITQQENLRRSREASTRPKKTHCKNGHEFAGDNLVTYAGAPLSRRCRTCMRVSAEKQRRKRGVPVGTRRHGY